ncbi:chaperone [Backusella circina FSU 941]|nr:chaperone [Backusella circina FSU 941]
MDFSQYTQAEQAQIAAMMEHKQMKDSVSLYNNLVQSCFMDCVNDFSTKSLTTKEEGCLGKCADKFFKHSERIGLRFSELQSANAGQQ